MRRSSAHFLTIFLALLLSMSHGFAAKKKGGGKKKQVASSSKGFGVAPPTLEEVISGFRTRLPESNDVDCPCGSSKSYKECCEIIHKGSRKCERPLDVLRSRYTAFSYRLVKHIMDTTHPTCRDYQSDKIDWAKDLNRQGMFDSYTFLGLEHGEETIDGDEGFIDFTVTMVAGDDAPSSLAGKQTNVSERSRFLKDENGAWSYASGEVKMKDATDDLVLN